MANELEVVKQGSIAKKAKGPAPIKVNEAMVYELATYHCTPEEIASLCGISLSTLKRRFDHVVAKGYDESKKQLRKAMIRSALSGNVIMQIWLSKNWLGFKERQPDEAPSTVINIQVNDIP